MGGQIEQVEFVQGNRQNNLCSNTYNPGWRNHPNFSWRGQEQQRQNQSSDFHNRGPPPPLPYETGPRNHHPRNKTNLEDLW